MPVVEEEGGGGGGPRTRPLLLIVTTGTYCDGTISQALLEAFSDGRAYDVVYVTDEKIPPRSAVASLREVYTYPTPSFIYTDPTLGAADPQRSTLAWAISHPTSARLTYDWMTMLGDMIGALEERYAPDAVLVHFSLLPAVARAERMAVAHAARDRRAGGREGALARSLTGRAPHVMLYLYPGFPNATLPWLFDGRLRERGFRLYSHEASEGRDATIRESWETLLIRQSMRNPSTSEARLSALRDMSCLLGATHHAIVVEPSILEQPLIPMVSGLDVEWLGSFVGGGAGARRGQGEGGQKKKKKKSELSSLPEGVALFLKQQQQQQQQATQRGGRRGEKRRRPRVAFVSFGSFGGVPALRRVALLVARELLMLSSDIAVIWHDTSPTSSPLTAQTEEEEEGEEGGGGGATSLLRTSSSSSSSPRRFMVHRGHVDYDAILPHLDLVVFTGSFCLQLGCVLHGVPMLFVPYLTEQFFWAKNYEHFTGVPYVGAERAGSVDAAYSLGEVEASVRAGVGAIFSDPHGDAARRAAGYYARVQRSMRARDPARALRAMVARVISERRARSLTSGTASPSLPTGSGGDVDPGDDKRRAQRRRSTHHPPRRLRNPSPPPPRRLPSSRRRRGEQQR